MKEAGGGFTGDGKCQHSLRSGGSCKSEIPELSKKSCFCGFFLSKRLLATHLLFSPI